MYLVTLNTSRRHIIHVSLFLFSPENKDLNFMGIYHQLHDIISKLTEHEEAFLVLKLSLLGKNKSADDILMLLLLLLLFSENRI